MQLRVGLDVDRAMESAAGDSPRISPTARMEPDAAACGLMKLAVFLRRATYRSCANRS
ncbi:MAG: hypothetical protein ACTHK7_08270 [Aureliella sp.]